MSVCLYCMIPDLLPTDVGGLCVSCAAAVNAGLMEIVDVPGRGRVVRTRAAFMPGGAFDPGRAYYPELLADDSPPTVGDAIGEWAGALAERSNRVERARELLAELEAAGVGVAVSAGAARIDRPGSVDPETLCDFRELRTQIEDLLDAPFIDAPGEPARTPPPR